MRPPRRSRRGLSQIWIIITVAMLAMGLSSIGFVGKEGPGLPTWGFFTVSTATAVYGFAYEAKRDRFAFWVGAIVFGALTGLGSAVPLSARGPLEHPIAAALFVVSCVAVVAGVGALLVGFFRRDPWPDVLLEHVDKRDIFELDGVHLALALEDNEVEAGGAVTLYVLAQNCWAGPRRLHFELLEKKPLGRSRTGMIVPERPALDLGPGEVGQLSLTIVAEPSASGLYKLRMRPHVEGSEGRRVRTRHRRAFNVEKSGALRLFALVGGEIIGRGGETLNLRVHPVPKGAPLSPAPARTSTMILWSPPGGAPEQVSHPSS